MSLEAEDNPFHAGASHVPAVLAGRDDETELLALVLQRLGGECRAGGKLARLPFPPVKIVGPRGAGKTALLNWVKAQAAEQKLRVVSCEQPARDPGPNFMRTLRADMAAVKKGPLLLLLDEAQRCDLPLLRSVLHGSQKLIGEGYPLGLVLAGTPGLDSHLAKTEATFIARCRQIRIGTLDGAAARLALSKPFRDRGVAVTPAALKALAALADDYPFFIQLAGREAWREMAQAGSREINAELVKRIEKKALRSRIEIYAEAYDRIIDGALLPQARQAMKLLEGKGGKMDKHALIGALARANRGMKDSQAMEIFAGLSADGFIWTVCDEVRPGIPSLFSYLQKRRLA